MKGQKFDPGLAGHLPLREPSWLLVCLALLLGVQSTFSQANFWQQTNGPCGGSVNALAINSSGHIFAGTSGSSVYRSTDNGGTWIQIKTGLTNSGVRSLAISSSGHIFAGTNGGVFRSTDNGGTWTQVNTGLTSLVTNAIAISANGDILAGTDGAGVFRSTDNGGNWIQVNSGLTNRVVHTLAISDSGYIYAGTDTGIVFRSTDSGGSWTALNTGPTSLRVNVLAINSRGHIFAGIVTTVGTFEPYICGRICLSRDNGLTWSQKFQCNEDSYVSALAIDSKGVIFAGTWTSTGIDGGARDGILRSTDNGDTWSQVHRGFLSPDVYSLALNSGGNLFAGTDVGVFLSADYGGTWTRVFAGPSKLSVRSLTTNSNGYIFAGTGSGLFRSTDKGGSWTYVLRGEGDLRASATGSSADIVAATNYVGSRFHDFNGLIFLSTNNGDSWTEVTHFWSIILALAINQVGHIFVSTYTDVPGPVLRSTDNGADWDAMLGGKGVPSITFNSLGHILVWASYVGVLRSTDNGDSWTVLNAGLSDRVLSGIGEFELGLNSDVFVAVKYVESGTLNYRSLVYRSIDNGEHWTETAWSGLEINSLAANSIGHIFAGTSRGIYRSIDRGGNWIQANAGLTDTSVSSAAVDSRGFLYAGTGSGVFRSVLSTVSVKELSGGIPTSFSLDQNYPNPFNPTTTIQFGLPRSGHVQMAVYDILGQRVQVLVDRYLEPGEREVSWDASRVASGIYFVRLEANREVRHIKMLVIK